MIIVLDTNILLVSIKSNTKYSIIFDKLISENYDLLISNEIIYEYHEIISRKMNSKVANKIVNFLVSHPSVHIQNVYYNWNLITNDESDNKFVDCAIAGSADFIVTNDKHFKVLENIEFPKIKTINIDGFINLLI